ncbi:hypothetical protein J6X15_02055 [Candidatus Saccharibacteria bacterium]|nr:hypothetical protein [Candidatus Saccharibacteria bacterium]
MDYKSFYDYAILAGKIGLVGILVAILFRIVLFLVGGILGVLIGILHLIALAAFYIGIPAMLILFAIAAVLYFKEKGV